MEIQGGGEIGGYNHRVGCCTLVRTLLSMYHHRRCSAAPARQMQFDGREWTAGWPTIEQVRAAEAPTAFLAVNSISGRFATKHHVMAKRAELVSRAVRSDAARLP